LKQKPADPVKQTMSTCTRGLAILLMIGTMGMSIFFAGAAETSAVTPLVDGNTTFALNLYGQLRGGTGNLFFSPYSISTCLGMTYAGARGQTAEQMAKALHFGSDPDKLAADFRVLQNGLNETQKHKGIELDVANALWAQRGFPLLPAFLDLARRQYDATIRQADFETAAEAARQEINAWVLNRTKDKIANLIPPGLVDGAKLVLVNAIYFKGTWTTPFKTNATFEMPFHTGTGVDITARMMNQTTEFGYGEPDGLQVLDLPYGAGELSMVILLPREPNGLSAIEAMLDPQKLEGWLGSARRRKVNVFLPKFKLEEQFELGKVLGALGMVDAFSERADFSGMDGRRDLLISAVIHKAFVDVNEQGTEAAAATAVVVLGMAVMRPEPIPVVRADHPFIFLIRDNRSGSILFLGRVTDPSL
jgi:serine protease inhibitor